MKVTVLAVIIILSPFVLNAETFFIYEDHKIVFPPATQKKISKKALTCSLGAAIKYQIPVNLFLAVAEKEGGSPGTKIKNKNGTFDVGYMQINTEYLQELSRYGITEHHVAADNCFAFDLAAWRIANHIQSDQGDLWTKAANYHSRTAVHNQRYRADLISKATQWADWLDQHLKVVKIQ